ncbi:hypothetical protein M4914_04860 [Streptomyces somaliensis DSM 40738]|uniref:AG1 protein n=1 Tax=Streptomyces somaliensis (strain ATCC 33201 / DSM 40738 / JCM 12659 / KCTC 9044 / NCTC 11332 / NRRL B-12077 / IP 733) TaxID=1134445 RepID=A0AA44DCR5_STRE0|nr:hypothetical protein [Streptomyces somaliensis]MCQ0022352.1 hypothetical protein [Streptomyces somaliensis DSM 40738]NKY14488.1 hypothetical protein [Streptomyces somaliensis DSM 40738]
MAWDEWEQLKAEARAGSEKMRLNALEPQPSGGGEEGDLKVNQQDLAAVGNSAFRLFEDLGKHGRGAATSTREAAKDLTTQEFELGAALSTVEKRWDKQLRSLLDACAHISNHMDFTRNAHAGDEYFIASTLSSIETLDQGFDRGTKN